MNRSYGIFIFSGETPRPLSGAALSEYYALKANAEHLAFNLTNDGDPRFLAEARGWWVNGQGVAASEDSYIVAIEMNDCESFARGLCRMFNQEAVIFAGVDVLEGEFDLRHLLAGGNVEWHLSSERGVIATHPEHEFVDLDFAKAELEAHNVSGYTELVGYEGKAMLIKFE